MNESTFSFLQLCLFSMSCNFHRTHLTQDCPTEVVLRMLMLGSTDRCDESLSISEISYSSDGA